MDRMNLTRIAELAGVSVSTVSRVISRPSMVNPETAERVRAVLARYPYEPNAMARRLLTRSSGTIGLCFITTTVERLRATGWFDAVIANSLAKTHSHRYLLMVNAITGKSSFERVRSALRQSRLDGVMFFADPGLDLDVNSILSLGYPVVYAGRSRLTERPPRFAQVTQDNFGGARKVVEHLIGLGHRRIAIMTGPMSWPTSGERLAGYRSVLEEHGLWDPALVFSCEHKVERSYEFFSAKFAGDWREREFRPTAIVCGGDFLAVGAIHAARDAGLAVPDDLSVAGYDHWDFRHYQLTSVESPVGAVTGKAMDLLLQLVRGEEVEDWDVRYPCEFAPGRTTAPPRSGAGEAVR